MRFQIGCCHLLDPFSISSTVGRVLKKIVDYKFNEYMNHVIYIGKNKLGQFRTPSRSKMLLPKGFSFNFLSLEISNSECMRVKLSVIISS